jgi:hypothetical protein
MLEPSMAFKGWAVSPGKVGFRSYSGLLDVFSLDSQRHSGEDEEIMLYISWQGNKDKKVLPWVRWDRIANPKALGGWGLKNIFFFSKALAEKCSWRLIKTSSLWTQVIHQKYIAPLSILDWVRSLNKSSAGASIIWKALIKDFDLVGMGLVWRVGNGCLVRLGLDPWPGCQLGHILPEGLRQRLALGGFFHLAQVGDPLTTNMWHQGWLAGHRLGLLEDDLPYWNRYTQNLRESSIRLVDRDDELLWDGVGDGEYTPRSGYLKLTTDLHQREPIWWWRKIWKQSCPAKGKLLIWSILANKIPTWDNLQRRLFFGPGRCALCKSHLETVDHLFLHCPFVKEVWAFAKELIPTLSDWQGNSFELALKAWLIKTWTRGTSGLPFHYRLGDLDHPKWSHLPGGKLFSRKGSGPKHWDLQILFMLRWGHCSASKGCQGGVPRSKYPCGLSSMEPPRLIRETGGGGWLPLSLTYTLLLP